MRRIRAAGVCSARICRADGHRRLGLPRPAHHRQRTVLAEDLAVEPFHLFPTRKSYATPTLAGPFAQLTTAAIDLGIARAALSDTVSFVSEFARPWIDAGVERASEDPLTIYQIGQLDSRLAAADALLERAGRCSTGINTI